MANEASIINNPTSTPAAVSTGYQRQNTRFISQANGVDHTVVDGGAGGVTVRISGPVDVNGVLYGITSAASLNIVAAGRYVVSLEGTGDLLTPTLGTALGTFDDSKNARYTAGGKRILNWLIYYDGVTAYAVKWLTPVSDRNLLTDIDTQPEEWITGNGNWTAPRSKYYTIYVTGDGDSGASGGSGGVPSGVNPTRGIAFGGTAGSTGIKRIWIDAGDVWTAVFGASANTFSDGVTTLSAGDDGGTVTGCDVAIIGGSGGYGGSGGAGSTTAGNCSCGHNGAPGGSSFYGGGGGGGHSGNVNYSGGGGGVAYSYGAGGGSGAGGGGRTTAGAVKAGGSGGGGKSGIIRIVG